MSTVHIGLIQTTYMHVDNSIVKETIGPCHPVGRMARIGAISVTGNNRKCKYFIVLQPNSQTI